MSIHSRSAIVDLPINVDNHCPQGAMQVLGAMSHWTAPVPDWVEGVQRDLGEERVLPVTAPGANPLIRASGPRTPLFVSLPRPALTRDRGGRGRNGGWIAQIFVPDRPEVVRQLVDQRDPGGDVESDDLVVSDAIEVLHERA